VVRDLADGDYLSVTRNGRRNSYSVNPDAPFRHPTLSHVTLGKFVEMISGSLPVALVASVSFHSGLAAI
ncbi:MAG TPA: hypothetical protein VIB47_11925, partial [Dehalococcoidia bacterium]